MGDAVILSVVSMHECANGVTALEKYEDSRRKKAIYETLKRI